MRNIFQKVRPTNLKLGKQMEHEDTYHRQALWPPRLKVKVARSRGPSDSCWPITRERKVDTKIGMKVARSMCNKARKFHGQKVKGQGHQPD